MSEIKQSPPLSNSEEEIHDQQALNVSVDTFRTDEKRDELQYEDLEDGDDEIEPNDLPSDFHVTRDKSTGKVRLCCRAFGFFFAILLSYASFFSLALVVGYPFESLISHIFQLSYEIKPPLSLELFITLYLVAGKARLLNGVCRELREFRIYLAQEADWPVDIPGLRIPARATVFMLNTIYGILYIGCFIYMFFFQFEAFHASEHQENEKNISRYDILKERPEDDWFMTLYMVLVCYILWVTVSLLHKDVILVTEKMKNDLHEHPMNVTELAVYWAIRVTILFQQLLATVVYGIPLFTYAIIIYKYHRDTLPMITHEWYLGIGIGASLVIGFLAGILEAKLPIIFQHKSDRGVRPKFKFESQVVIRAWLMYTIFFPALHYFFLKPFKPGEHYTRTSNEFPTTFLLYGQALFLYVLHFVKILVVSYLDNKTLNLVFSWRWSYRPHTHHVLGEHIRIQSQNIIRDMKGQRPLPSNTHDSTTIHNESTDNYEFNDSIDLFSPIQHSNSSVLSGMAYSGAGPGHTAALTASPQTNVEKTNRVRLSIPTLLTLSIMPMMTSRTLSQYIRNSIIDEPGSAIIHEDFLSPTSSQSQLFKQRKASLAGSSTSSTAHNFV